MHKSIFASRRLTAFNGIRAATQQLAQISAAEAPALSLQPPRDPQRREVWWLKQLEAIAVFLSALAEELAGEQ